jgi:hypothetical protein
MTTSGGVNHDIEEAKAVEGPGTTVTAGDSSVDPPSRTSKSVTSVRVTVDPVLYSQLAARAAMGRDGDDCSSEDSFRRKATLCCGSCCDLVTACVIADVLNVVVMIINLIMSLLEMPGYLTIELNQSANEMDDDTLELPKFDWIGIVGITRTVLGIPFGLLGIWAARKFSKPLVLSVGIWHCIYGLLSVIFSRRLVGLFMAGFMAYPHFHLFFELKSGNITKENYKKSEQHCCFGGSK